MIGMRLDHLSYAAGPDGLAATAEQVGSLLGATFIDGGIHPRFGTVNMTLALADGTYLEIVEALDHPASDKAPFGQAVKARSSLGGGWLGGGWLDGGWLGSGRLDGGRLGGGRLGVSFGVIYGGVIRGHL